MRQQLVHLLRRAMLFELARKTTLGALRAIVERPHTQILACEAALDYIERRPCLADAAPVASRQASASSSPPASSSSSSNAAAAAATSKLTKQHSAQGADADADGIAAAGTSPS